MTDSERRGLVMLLVILGAGALLSAATERFPGLLPDLLRRRSHGDVGPAVTGGVVENDHSPASRAAVTPLGAMTASIAAMPAAARPAGTRARPAPRSLDVNACDAAALTALPGIGPTRARALVAERASHGPFRGARDLLRVRGIGPRILQRIEPYLVFPSPRARSRPPRGHMGPARAPAPPRAPR